MRPLLRYDQEFEVLGLRLTIRRTVGIAVLLCLLVLAALMATELLGNDNGGPPYNLTQPNNTTGRYEEDDPNWVLCSVFIFLALVVAALLVFEVGS